MTCCLVSCPRSRLCRLLPAPASKTTGACRHQKARKHRRCWWCPRLWHTSTPATKVSATLGSSRCTRSTIIFPAGCRIAFVGRRSFFQRHACKSAPDLPRQYWHSSRQWLLDFGPIACKTSGPVWTCRAGGPAENVMHARAHCTRPNVFPGA